MPTATVRNGEIRIDDSPIRIMSGAMHYFRIHPELWGDRLDKAVALGLNTIETYVCWNLHEPRPGEFDFSGMLDLERYLEEIAARGLYAIVRPGPYICAEWEGGGLPGWLSAIPGMAIRCSNQPFLEAADRYYGELLPRLRKHLITNGGNIIAMQVENEYGSFGCDREYLRHTAETYRKHGMDVILFTSDGPSPNCLNGGPIDGCMMTVNFGSRSDEAFDFARTRRPEGPDFCMEFWNGWFDHWGEKHHVRPAAEAAAELDAMLTRGANVNLYMFHGGTNFGFTAGANGHFGTDYAPTVTSYDYDAPLSECGDPTPKFRAFQEVIRKHLPSPRIADVAPTKKITPAPVGLTASLPLAAALEEITGCSGSAVVPPTMEELPDNFGFIYYRKTLRGPLGQGDLRLFQVNDYAQVYLDGRYLGSRMRDDGTHPLPVSVGASGATLELLVENCGRVNYGPYVGRDHKGIAGSVCIDLQIQTGWEYRTLPLAKPPTGGFGEFRQEQSGACFHRGTFELAGTGDTFLRRPGVKGVVWINGFNLGRYWAKGPQETLYVPAPVLKKGCNEIVILELEALRAPQLEFTGRPDLGPTE